VFRQGLIKRQRGGSTGWLARLGGDYVTEYLSQTSTAAGHAKQTEAHRTLTLSTRAPNTSIKTSIVPISKEMASLLLLRRPLAIGLGLTSFCTTYALLQPSRQSRLLYCDSYATPLSSSLHSYSTNAQVPVVKKGRPNPAAYKQISSGSILGTLPFWSLREADRSAAGMGWIGGTDIICDATLRLLRCRFGRRSGGVDILENAGLPPRPAGVWRAGRDPLCLPSGDA